jgi:hypothetical protein
MKRDHNDELMVYDSQFCEQDLKRYMDTHGDRGALDLVTVKNFTHQLLTVSSPRRAQTVSIVLSFPRVGRRLLKAMHIGYRFLS